MANQVSIRSRDDTSDLTEMNTDASLIDVSNHSYSRDSGWKVDTASNYPLIPGTGNINVWLADRSNFAVEDPDFGAYATRSSALDQILDDNPYLLSVWAAGNERGGTYTDVNNDNLYATFFSTNPSGTSPGWSGPGWYLVSNTGATAAPPADGNGGTGFDTLNVDQVAKNSLSIGAIFDITTDPYSPSQISATNFSSFGPTDDGRIKPDLVANGWNLWSAQAGSNSDYGWSSGTSMAAPNAAGTSVLVIEHFEKQLAYKPRAATSKGVLIHTAIDGGNTGPDYRFGWGLINAVEATDFISRVQQSTDYLAERTYFGSEQTLQFISDGTNPLKATIVWSDVEGAAQPTNVVDSPTSVLVNDLDLWITGPGGTFRPWTLNPNNPTAAAVRNQRNFRDNVEQVLIDAPAAGTYTIHIGDPGGSFIENYSLLVSGALPGPPPVDGVIELNQFASASTGGTIGSEFERDTYLFFAVDNSGTMQIDVTESSGLDPGLRLWDLQNNTLVAFDFNGGSDLDDARISTNLTARRLYLAEVFAEDSGSGDYDITFDGPNAPIINVPLDIDGDGGLNGSLTSRADTNYYWFDAPLDTSGKLTITVATASEFSPDIVVTLYDNAGNQLKRVDNEGVGITGTTEVLAFEGVVPDQRLLVRVGSKGYGTSGPYTIDVNFDSAPLTEYFYATDITSHRLVQIDPSNGHVIDVGIPVPGQTLAGLALTNSGALFGHLAYSEFGGNSLYEIDRLTGTGRLVGSIGMDVGGGLAYDPNRDRIYAISHTGGQLIRISQTTGQGFTIGSGNSGLDSPGAAAFDTDQDRLIVFDDADNEFYEFNPSNGNATLLSVATTSLSSFAMAYTGSRFVVNENVAGTLRRVFPDSGSSSHQLTPDQNLVISALEYVPDESTSRLLGIDFEAATLYDVGYRTGAALNARPTGLEDAMGIAIDERHDIYVLTALTAAPSNSLFRIDRSTGAATLIGALGLSVTEGDLSFDPTTGVLYGISTAGRNLFVVDTLTGQGSVVGSVGTSGDLSAIAFDARGNLYVLDSDNERLLRVNKSTATITSTVNLSSNFPGGIDSLGDKMGMDFDPESGNLFVVDGGGTSASDAMFSLNTSTGVLTPVGTTGLLAGLSGLEFLPRNGVIRGKKFHDEDGDSNLDSSEVGLPGWDIFIDYDQDGVVDPVTTTTRPGPSGPIPDAGYNALPLVVTGLSGPVLDINVTLAGGHSLPFRLDAFLVSPSGTTVNLFSPNTLGSIASVTFDDERSAPGSIWAEELLSILDGENPNGVWQLVIGDTVFDSVIGFIIGWSITFNHGEQVVTSDANGNYVFSNLKPGSHTVAEVQQAGWTRTWPWLSENHVVTVNPFRVAENRMFGNFQPSEIHGAKWNDEDGNGTHDPGEPTLPNWPMYLDFDDDDQIDPIITTARSGPAFGLPDVGSNALPLVVTGLEGPIQDLNVSLTIATPNVATLDAFLISPRGNTVNLFSPGRFSGTLNTTLDDEGLKAEGRLAGFDGEPLNGAWHLVVTDAFQDSQLAVVSAWSLQFTHGEQQTSTDGSGNYSFTGLKSGNVNVAEKQQSFWQQTFPNNTFWDESVHGDLSDEKHSPTIVAAGPGNTVISGVVGPGSEDDVFGFVVPPGGSLDSIILQDYQSASNTTFLGIDDNAYYVSAIGSHAFGIADVGTDILPHLTTPPLGPGAYSFWLDENQSAEPYRLQFNFSGIEAGGKHRVVLQPGEILNDLDFGNQHEMDYGDAPDPDYPTLIANNGARHWNDNEIFLGASRDIDPDGQPSIPATADDTDGIDDEDGVVFTSTLIVGEMATLEVTVAGGGVLNAWLDLDSNGNWGEVADHVIDDLPLGAGVHSLSFPIPAGATLGQTYARFRVNSIGNLSYDGLALDGEVEDYSILISQNVEVPLPTGQSNNIVIRRNGDQLEVVDQNGPVVLSSTPIATTNSLIVTGSDTEIDTIVIDLTAGGVFELLEGIEVLGGGNLGDSLTIIGDGTTQATHMTAVVPAGQAQVQLSNGPLVKYDVFENRSFEGLDSFTVVGMLNIGAGTITVDSANPVELGSLSIIGGGTFTAASGVTLGSGKMLTGNGQVLAKFSGAANSVVKAEGGDLTVGDPNSESGFTTSGEIKTLSKKVILLDANRADVKSKVTLGNSEGAGTLVAAKGLKIEATANIDGEGTLDAPDNPTAAIVNDGSIKGKSVTEELTVKGHIKGKGTLDKVRVKGTLSPGDSPASVQYGSVAYETSSTTVIEIGGATPGSEHDQINHSGTAALAGTLDVQLIGGFTPSVGDSFVILSASGGISGTFNSANLPPAPSGAGWHVDYGTTEVVVKLMDLAQVSSFNVGNGNSTTQRSQINQLDVVFDGQVDIDIDAFTFEKRGPGGGVVSSLFTTSTDVSGNTIATFQFSGVFARGAMNALVDGNYELTIDPNKVRRAGTSLTLDGDDDGAEGGIYNIGTLEADLLYSLFGDSNANGTVDFDDFSAFGAVFGSSDDVFDFNGNTTIDFDDFSAFGARFGSSRNFQ
jgi:subtilisin-like proprotein convertase family protein